MTGRGRLLAALLLAASASPGCFLFHRKAEPVRPDGDRSGREEGKGAKGKGREGGAAAPKPEAPNEPAEKGVPPRGNEPRVPASPEGLLAPGAVGELQAALRDRGYLKDGQAKQGELDDATSAAVRRFQADEGLASTGMPDRETLRRLGISAEDAYGRDKSR